MKEQQLAKLIRKNAARAARAAQRRPARRYDSTLPERPEEEADVERARMFEEMRKREF